MHLDKVVIGNCFESVFFAFVNDCYHVQNCDLRPLFYDTIDNFSMFGSNNRKVLWQRFKYYNGLLGRNLDYDNLSSIRISGNMVKFFDTNLLDKYDFGSCYIFDTDKVLHENNIKEHKDQTYKVIDDFRLSRISPHNPNPTCFSTGEKFVEDIHMYNSGRVEGSKHPTDVLCTSIMSKDQLHSFEYSDTMAGFKLRKFLSENGYEGRYEKGRYKNGEKIYKKILLEHVQRLVFSQDNNLYSETEHVIIGKVPIEKIVKNAELKKRNKYGWHCTD